MRRILSTSALLLTGSLASFACSDPVTPPAGTGGAGSGGVGSGGAPLGSGGAGSGGAPVGSGGASSGGLTGSGGAATGGGTGSGGAATGGGTGSGGAASGGGTGSGGESGGEFTLTSTGLADGAAFADANTCAGGGGTLNFGLALDFAWSGAPEGTQSYAMVMLDTFLTNDGNRLGYHSAFWNLPTTVTSLPAEFGTSDLEGAMVINGGYLGPCPSGVEHTYTFTLYALPDPTITLSTTAFNMLNTAEEFVATLEAAALDTAVLNGTSDAAM